MSNVVLQSVLGVLLARALTQTRKVVRRPHSLVYAQAALLSVVAPQAAVMLSLSDPMCHTTRAPSTGLR